MIGLIGFASGSIDQSLNLIDLMLSTTSFRDIRKKASFQTIFCSGICLHHGIFDHKVIASDVNTGTYLLLDGWVRGCVPEFRDAAEYCLEQFIEVGSGFVEKLNGQFNIANRTIFFL